MEKVLRGLVANGGLSTMGQALGFAASLVEERCAIHIAPFCLDINSELDLCAKKYIILP